MKGKGGVMRFHACWVIYTVKELDSHAKHGQSFKKWFGSITECQIHTFGFLTSFGKFFSIVALHDVMKEGTPYMHISPGKTRPCTHRPERKREKERAYQCYIRHHCTGLAREEYLQRSVFLFSQYVWELHSEWDLQICTKWERNSSKM